VEDVIGLLHEAAISRAVLIGPSMGGIIAMALSSFQRDLIEAAAGAPAPEPELTGLFMALSAGQRVLLIHGERSHILDQATATAIRGLAPSMEYVEIPGVDHARRPCPSQPPRRRSARSSTPSPERRRPRVNLA